jgi:hypothetical protein
LAFDGQIAHFLPFRHWPQISLSEALTKIKHMLEKSSATFERVPRLLGTLNI